MGKVNSSILKRAIPFLLALIIGLAVDSFVTRLWVQSEVFHKIANDAVPLTIYSVPDVDFSEEIKRSKRFVYAQVRLEAIFDEDGSIKSVRPFPMLPYGVTESAAGVGEFADVTPFMLDARFVNALPYGLTESAIRQVSEIDYSPKKLNGRSVPQRVTVLTRYSYSESRFAVGCGNIDVTIIDDTGVLWKGNTWVSKNRGCV